MAENVIEVEGRETMNRNSCRRLRAAGNVPGVVYGLGRDAFSVSVPQQRLDEILRLESGQNTILQLKLRDSDHSRHVMIREFQFHPVSNQVLHVDFLRIDMDTAVEVRVPVSLVGTAKGVKEQDGLLEFVNRELSVECLPKDIPEHIEVDVSELEVGHHLQVSDLPADEKLRYTDDPELTIVTVALKRAEETPDTEEDEEAAAAAPAAASDAEGEDTSAS